MIAAAEARLIAIALALLALAGAVWYVVHNERRIGAEKIVEASQKAAREEGDRRLAQQSENLDELARLTAQQRDADLRGADLDRRLRDAASSGRLAPRPAAAASGPAGESVPAAYCVSSDMYARLEQAYRDVARYADCLRTSGGLCAADYSALSP